MYVSNNTWVDGSNQNGEFRISEVNDKVSKDEDKFAMVTALFSGNEIQFKWGKEYPSNNYTPEKVGILVCIILALLEKTS